MQIRQNHLHQDSGVEVLNNNVNELMYGQMTAQECVDSWMEQSLEILAK